MISEERYRGFLKAIISCISHGDYYSVKELSQLELDKLEKESRNQSNSHLINEKIKK